MIKKISILIICLLVIFIIAGQSLKADTVGTEVFIVPFLPVPTPLGPAPDRHPPVIFNVFIKNVTFDGATITWNTNEKARTVFHYGLTQQYGQGSIINDQFLTSHQVILSDLFSNKTYHFQIVAFDKNNNQTTSDDYFFETLEVVDDIPPGNIRVFDSEVTADNQAIRLTWLNPPDEDLRGIKIQRRTDQYPLDPEDGLTIFDGLAEEYLDTDVVPNTQYFYTAFTYDQSLNFSSGAFTRARITAEAVLKLQARPEKRIPRFGNFATEAAVEVRLPGSLKIISVFSLETDDQGYSEVNLGELNPGFYDIALKGLSHLRKVVRNFEISFKENFVDFTRQETVYLEAGDTHDSYDNMINALDISSLLGFLNTSHKVSDLNQDTLTNSIDINILLANLMKRGED